MLAERDWCRTGDQTDGRCIANGAECGEHRLLAAIAVKGVVQLAVASSGAFARAAGIEVAPCSRGSGPFGHTHDQ